MPLETLELPTRAPVGRPFPDLIDIGVIDGRRMAMARAPSSQRDIRAWLIAEGLPEASEYEDRPEAAARISWELAVAYAAGLSRQTGLRYRLPTETEWLAAADANAGPNLTETAQGPQPGRANLDFSGVKLSHLFPGPSVPGKHPASAAGFLDLFGNVWEHTLTAMPDWGLMHGTLPQFHAKGGSWCTPAALATLDAVRPMMPMEHYPDTGVRLACELDGPPLADSEPVAWSKRILFWSAGDAPLPGLTPAAAHALLDMAYALQRPALTESLGWGLAHANRATWPVADLNAMLRRPDLREAGLADLLAGLLRG